MPLARREIMVDDFHGTKIADPYRWMEDADAPELKEWYDEQNAITQDYLSRIAVRPEIKQRLTALWNYPKFSAPQKVAGHYFFFKNNGLQNQSVLYMQSDLDAEPVQIIDPNSLSDDGTVALTNLSYSKDGKLLAYATSQSGSDWQEIRVRQIDSGQDLPDLIKWCKFRNIAWTPDNAGFFYSRFPEAGSVPKEDASNFNKVYYHRLGTRQADDCLVYERPDRKEWGFNPFITDDGEYLCLSISIGTAPRSRFYYRPLKCDQPFIELLDGFDAEYHLIGNVGTIFYFQTTHAARRGRVIAIDLNHPQSEKWREIIPQGDDVIAFSSMVNDQLVVVTMHHAHHQLAIYTREGEQVHELALPMVGAVVGLSGKAEDREMFLTLTSYLTPPTIYRYDFSTKALTKFRDAEIKFSADDYETRQVFFTSKDGTKIPMFITARKGIQLDGTHPTLLTGYGGFNISHTPTFSVSNLVWLEMGGIYVDVCLRGGSEYGEDWHHAGMLEKKQNVFDDFIGAAEWLIQSGYTSVKKLAIMGGSNGGLLVAACMLQRPDLYGAVVCRVPVTDMLRYHKFTAGRFWTPEYGNAETNSEHFKFMIAYSPLHNVKLSAVYPPIIVMTADHDDRVVPMHSFKFAATLQAAAASENPILLRVESRAGHGMGKPTAKVIEETADIYA
ncbi:MAG: prolyl oligopeptidase family serine peptidase, partial [Bacillota bacterium]